MPADLLLPSNRPARVTDYFGLWAMRQEEFAGLWLTAKRTDLSKHFAAGPVPRQTETMTTVPGKNGKNVAVVNLRGTLMKGMSSFGGTSTVQARKDLRSAASDSTVSGILLNIDSPGGTVAGTADLAADVRAAGKKKPVFAFAEDLTASAAYWVASQAKMIFANTKSALVGSIGTILTVYDESAAAEAQGVKVRVFATGPLKGAGTPGAPITDEQAADFQKLVNETQTHFDAAVLRGRGLSSRQLADVRTGGVFLAEEAVGRKLIDGIGSLDSTIAALAAAGGMS